MSVCWRIARPQDQKVLPKHELVVSVPFVYWATEYLLVKIGGSLQVKIPFKMTRTWTDGRSIIKLRSVEFNAPIDAAKFSKPAPPVPPSKQRA